MLISIFIWLLMLFSPGVDQTQGKNHAPDKTNGKTKNKNGQKNEPPVFQGNEHGKKTRVDLPFRNRPMQRQMRNVFLCPRNDKKQPDLTFDEIKKISETAGQFNRLWISGGEPTLREDLPEILELFYKNNHIKE